MGSAAQQAINPFKLTFVFHSCFILETASTAIIFDFFRDTTSNSVANFVQNTNKHVYFVNSHAHPDHFSKNIFDIIANTDADVKIILSRDIKIKLDEQQRALITHFIKLNEVYHDENIRLTACPSTDVGCSFAVEIEGFTAYHAGDNNNWYLVDEMDNEKLNFMERCFLATVDDISQSFSHFNVVMFPVDPRLGDEIYRGPRQFLDRIHADYFVPMHLWGDYDLPAKTAFALKQYGCEFLINDDKDKVLINNLL